MRSVTDIKIIYKFDYIIKKIQTCTSNKHINLKNQSKINKNLKFRSH